MIDVQQRKDSRGIAIQQVGVNDVHLPCLIKTKDGGFQQVLSSVRFTVSLPMEYKGTHMSRFLEILMPWSKKPLAEPEMEKMLDEALESLDAQAATLKIGFKYFVDKIAPVSGRLSCLDYDCYFLGEKSKNEPMLFTLGVNVPLTSLCPCSKEISTFGAHNQRSECRAAVRFRAGVECIYIEDLAALLEAQGSSPIYPLLKREDEKFVTEAAYENPKFVEDILRDSIVALRRLPGLCWFFLECENFESIHNHSAFASHSEILEK